MRDMQSRVSVIYYLSVSFIYRKAKAVLIMDSVQ